MKREEIEAVLGRLFRTQFPERQSVEISATAHSVAHSIYLDSKLSDIREDALEKIIDAYPHTLDFITTMKKLRMYKDRFQNQPPKLSPEDQKALDWGFLLKCWFSFKDRQDVHDIDRMTMMFTAQWIIKEKIFIEADELEWCETTARSHSDTIHDKEEKTSLYREILDEAVVFVVLRKLRVKSWTDPLAFDKFIEEKKRIYEAFSLRTYGVPPSYDKCCYRNNRQNSSPIAAIKPLKPEQFIKK